MKLAGRQATLQTKVLAAMAVVAVLQTAIFYFHDRNTNEMVAAGRNRVALPDAAAPDDSHDEPLALPEPGRRRDPQ